MNVTTTGSNKSNQSSDNSGKMGERPKKCCFCGQGHPTFKCRTTKPSPKEALAKAKKGKLCIQCLRWGHFIKDCKSKVCTVKGCGKKQHRWLHIKPTSTGGGGNEEGRTPPQDQEEDRKRGDEGEVLRTPTKSSPKKKVIIQDELDIVQEKLEKDTVNSNKTSVVYNTNNVDSRFREMNAHNMVPFKPRSQVLVNANALLDVSASSKDETSRRPLQPLGLNSGVDSSNIQQYVVLPIVNVQAMDRQGNQMQLKTLLYTGSTSSFISVSASNKVMLVGESDEIHVDLKTLGGTNSVPTKEITFRLYHSNKHLRKSL